MTSVYGVTHIGARQQIQNRLKERGAVDDENLRYQIASSPLRTLDALSNLFVNARHVMAWLAECAKVVVSRGRAVEWTTPMGLPVVQPYRAKGKKVIRTLVQSFVLQFENDENKVQKNKQRSAFPPNFIHSIDSAHMMKTAVACHEAGLTFAGVHDSFWTHAGTSRRCRGTFAISSSSCTASRFSSSSTRSLRRSTRSWRTRFRRRRRRATWISSRCATRCTSSRESASAMEVENARRGSTSSVGFAD